MLVHHGTILTPDEIQADRDRLALEGDMFGVSLNNDSHTPHRFDYMFPELQENKSDRLDESPDTRSAIMDLGRSMRQPIGTKKANSTIPAGYTYFGQFVAHDIAFEAAIEHLPRLLDPAMVPMSLDDVHTKIVNTRTGLLDLDSVYQSPAKQDPESGLMALGSVTPIKGSAPSHRRPSYKAGEPKDEFNDLPRLGENNDNPKLDRTALIGDPRNDENLIVSQLHVAFLRAHNYLIEEKELSFAEAQTILRQHYHFLVIHDFLKRISDPDIFRDVLDNGNIFYRPTVTDFYLPLEFTVAAYRFGHSMVRSSYDYNQNFNSGRKFLPATLGRLFTFTAFSGSLGPSRGMPSVLENWIIEWENFVEGGRIPNYASTIDTHMVEPLYRLNDVQGIQEKDDAARLAVRNLLRGYLLRMPTGQSVAHHIGVPPLSSDDMLNHLESEEQKTALGKADLLERTPLWYYLLAEASIRGGGDRLGPVGSRIVCEVLVELVRRSTDSIFDAPGWKPWLGAVDGEFTLADLLWLSGNLPDRNPNIRGFRPRSFSPQGVVPG